jgi:pyruvate dehydrogenase E2 component (dihydrolipoamide acetyltransferase)
MSVIEASEVGMPRLSDSMEEGTIIAWLKQTGDTVAPGDALVEIETDKATVEYEAETGGVLEIIAESGSTVALGQPIARLLPDGGLPQERTESTASRESGEAETAAASAEPAAQAAQAAQAAAPAGNGQRLLATPVARRVAHELGIELAAVTASGRRGQIMKADVEKFAMGAAPEPFPRETRGAPSLRREELNRIQRTVARRMAHSRAVVPDFSVEVDVDMDLCLTLRSDLAHHLDPVPSINDLIIKACALSLRAHARVNAAYRDDGFDLYEPVNIGVAVAAQDALLVGVVHDADSKRIGEIAADTRRLAARARSGDITPAELSGATFTVSNLGMFGIDRFTAIINAPQAAILAVGGVKERPVVRDGRLAVGRMMTATLAADHRILYGADAARFLTDVRDYLQAPLGLVA